MEMMKGDDPYSFNEEEGELSRKRVSLTFSASARSKQARARAGSKPKVPKKHFLGKFEMGRLIGSIKRLTREEIGVAVAGQDSRQLKFRKLSAGSPVFPDSPASVFVEIQGRDEYKALMERNSALDSIIRGMKEEFKVLKAKSEKVELFVEDVYDLTLRAFYDKMLEYFYKGAGKDHLEAQEKKKWLSSPEAVEFVLKKPEIPFFDGKLKLGARVLKTLRGAKSASSELSDQKCHATKPIRVAYALAADSSTKNNDVNWLFEKAFGLSALEMMKNYEDGDKERFTVKFKADR